MKIIFSLLLLFAVLFTNALPTNLEKQDPQDVYRIAESYITDSESPSLDLSNGIISPQNGAVWHVGEKVQVVFKPDLPDNETVAIFFYHQTDVLAGGSLEKKTFEFVVPPTAVSPPGGTSLLLGVRRVEHYLDAVDQVNVTVLAA